MLIAEIMILLASFLVLSIFSCPVLAVESAFFTQARSREARRRSAATQWKGHTCCPVFFFAQHDNARARNAFVRATLAHAGWSCADEEGSIFQARCREKNPNESSNDKECEAEAVDEPLRGQDTTSNVDGVFVRPEQYAERVAGGNRNGNAESACRDEEQVADNTNFATVVCFRPGKKSRCGGVVSLALNKKKNTNQHDATATSRPRAEGTKNPRHEHGEVEVRTRHFQAGGESSKALCSQERVAGDDGGLTTSSQEQREAFPSSTIGNETKKDKEACSHLIESTAKVARYTIIPCLSGLLHAAKGCAAVCAFCVSELLVADGRSCTALVEKERPCQDEQQQHDLVLPMQTQVRQEGGTTGGATASIPAQMKSEYFGAGLDLSPRQPDPCSTWARQEISRTPLAGTWGPLPHNPVVAAVRDGRHYHEDAAVLHNLPDPVAPFLRPRPRPEPLLAMSGATRTSSVLAPKNPFDEDLIILAGARAEPARDEQERDATFGHRSEYYEDSCPAIQITTHGDHQEATSAAAALFSQERAAMAPGRTSVPGAGVAAFLDSSFEGTGHLLNQDRGETTPQSNLDPASADTSGFGTCAHLRDDRRGSTSSSLPFNTIGPATASSMAGVDNFPLDKSTGTTSTKGSQNSYHPLSLVAAMHHSTSEKSKDCARTKDVYLTDTRYSHVDKVETTPGRSRKVASIELEQGRDEVRHQTQQSTTFSPSADVEGAINNGPASSTPAFSTSWDERQHTPLSPTSSLHANYHDDGERIEFSFPEPPFPPPSPASSTSTSRPLFGAVNKKASATTSSSVDHDEEGSTLLRRSPVSSSYNFSTSPVGGTLQRLKLSGEELSASAKEKLKLAGRMNFPGNKQVDKVEKKDKPSKAGADFFHNPFSSIQSSMLMSTSSSASSSVSARSSIIWHTAKSRAGGRGAGSGTTETTATTTDAGQTSLAQQAEEMFVPQFDSASSAVGAGVAESLLSLGRSSGRGSSRSSSGGVAVVPNASQKSRSGATSTSSSRSMLYPNSGL
ncbi:unnamed protein product [Amoebophrya sp. A120]|nr:unnamed protein product [Amoebophrya sp. A120]|eukprot:GSA120T00020068001.1